jgi:hypothetical protein
MRVLSLMAVPSRTCSSRLMLDPDAVAVPVRNWKAVAALGFGRPYFVVLLVMK